MKTLIFAVLIAISANANAAMWTLVKSDYQWGEWICTYQMSGTQYFAMIRSKTMCQQFIYD